MCKNQPAYSLPANNGLRPTKISHDPNNTVWSRSTTGFGQKILLSQGWSPGGVLGAKDAPHASLYTQSSASYIRVALKDDNLGIGAKRGANASENQCTGLDVFQDVLGRLNGKHQPMIEAEQKSKEDQKKAIHTERRWSSLRFVSGGLLVGDRIQQLVEDNKKQLSTAKDGLLHPSRDLAASERANKIVKPRVQKLVGKSPEIADVEKAKKIRKRRRFRSTNESLEIESEIFFNDTEHNSTNIGTKFGYDTPIENELGQQSASKAQRWAEKAERKLQRKLRRQAKEEARAEQNVESSDMHTTPTSPQHLPSSIVEDPSTLTAGTAGVREAQLRDGAVGGRHAVRQRYIRQKKMAIMDTKALHEVCSRAGLR